MTVVLYCVSNSAFAQQEAPPASAAASTRTATPYPQVFPSQAHVTFVSTQDGAVLRREANDKWVDVCQAPCESLLDPAGTYHVDGPGMSTSRTFSVPVGSSLIKAHPGSFGLRVGGILTTSVGGVISMFGLIAYATSGLCYTQEKCDKSQVDSARASGLLTVGLGLALAVVGVVMIAKGRTTVSTDVALATRGFAF